MTAVLWVLYAFVLPQFGILSTGKEIIFSKMFNSAPDNEDPMAHNPLKSPLKQVACGGGVEYDESQNLEYERSVVSHLDMLDYDSSTDENARSKRSASGEGFQRKIIEVAVFVDSAFYSLYKKKVSGDPETAIRQRVRDIMEEAQTYYSHHTLDIKFKLKLVKIEILKPNMSAPNNHGGKAQSYLLSFCRWQSKLNKEDGMPGHWDHAALITGMEIFEYAGGETSPKLGYGYVGYMCINEASCSINRGTRYGAGATVAHEIAHSLNVNHDGDENNCDSSKYLMGGRNLNWSRCSNRYINNFIRSGKAWCLANDDTLVHNGSYGLKSFQHKASGTMPTLDEQCKLSLGPGYSVFQDEQPPFNDVCRQLWCRSEVDSDKPKCVGKAQDGSPCGENMHCMNGSCRPVNSDQKS